MVTSSERRTARVELSQTDQEFLSKMRERFGQHSGSRKFLDQGRLRRLLRIRDKYLGRRLFAVIDSDGDGRISEEDLLSVVTEITLGSDQKKLRFVFALHDADGDGRITAGELDEMLKASLRHSTLRITPVDRQRVSEALVSAGSGTTRGRKRGIDFGEFRKLLGRDRVVRTALLQSVSAWFGAEPDRQIDVSHRRLSTVLRYLFVVVPYYAWRVLLVAAYVGANIYFFGRAFLEYREAGATLAIQIARGGGACLNFNGMLILIPMMRTMLTWIRKTFLTAFVPVDQNIEIHAWVGRVMFVFALAHSAAHIVNYAATQDGIWVNLIGTWVGATGGITMAVFLIMWLFSLSGIRRSRIYEFFSATHTLYWVWFPAAMIHVDSFFRWTIVPVIGFLIELAIRRFIKREQSFVDDAVVHESGATHLMLHRPERFRFRAGEYLFLRVPSISRFGWHPFTISSAPENEKYVGVHIRTLGNWTKRLYRIMKALPKTKRRMPAQIHGAYGAPSSRIFNSRFAVLIGAGIGVTPFASILESISMRKQAGLEMKLEKVYFFWLYRGQKTFEWIADVISDLEARTSRRLLDVNIYLTDAKIDPTNGLLKIGMDIVGKRQGTDVLTGLKSPTNFGRPDWPTVFGNIARKHELNRVNVFFCGPYPLGRLIRIAARKVGFHFRMENF